MHALLVTMEMRVRTSWITRVDMLWGWSVFCKTTPTKLLRSMWAARDGSLGNSCSTMWKGSRVSA